MRHVGRVDRPAVSSQHVVPSGRVVRGAFPATSGHRGGAARQRRRGSRCDRHDAVAFHFKRSIARGELRVPSRRHGAELGVDVEQKTKLVDNGSGERARAVARDFRLTSVFLPGPARERDEAVSHADVRVSISHPPRSADCLLLCMEYSIPFPIPDIDITTD